LTVNAWVVDGSGSTNTDSFLFVDRVNIGSVELTTGAETTAGEDKSAVHSIATTDKHLIDIYLRGASPSEMFVETTKVGLKSIDTDGTITGVRFSDSIHFVGDSWMASNNNWASLLHESLVTPYKISFGGSDSQELDAKYDYDFDGELNTTDPTPSLIICQSSINDARDSMDTGVFNSNMSSLVDKIRTKHPTVPIWMFQSPDSAVFSFNALPYGDEMESIASTRDNVFYFSSPESLWPTLSYQGDNIHLSLNDSTYTFAAWIESEVGIADTFRKMESNVDGDDVYIYSAYDGNVFSDDGSVYFRGVRNGDSVSVPAVGLTAYAQ
jgi:hypothetical protein